MSITRLVAGAMSGTSADGVDVAIVRIEGAGYGMSPCLVWHHYRPYTPGLRQAIFDVRGGGTVELPRLAELARQLALVYAAAVNETLLATRLSSADLSCIAAHGQTLYHAPPLTMQWLDPALLAAETGCTVVSDFRRSDCAAGGQGAPLVPFADYVMFRHREKNRVMVNIGGIANLTYLPAGADAQWVQAFDTGPGNCISDWLVRTLDPGGPGYDEGGLGAMAGEVVYPAVERMLNNPYFWQRPPRSTDGPAMIGLFQACFGPELQTRPLSDLLATATAITARALAQAMHRFLPHEPDQVILSGGGIRNQAILTHLQRELGRVPLLSTDDLGVRSAAKEAIAFALIGLATLDHLPANLPAATGARRAVVLGSITPSN
jgi:anhydro-N-acetylmuramic acid kinase